MDAEGEVAMRGAQLFAWGAGMAVALAAIGCRDGQGATARDRLSDNHILAGRSPARGGPAITALEARARRVQIVDSDLGPLQAYLRSNIAGSFDVKGALRAEFAGAVETFTPALIGPPPGVTTIRTLPAGIPFASLPVQDMRFEYIRLCNNPLVGPKFPALGSSAPGDDPCDPLPIVGLNDRYLDHLTITPDFGSTVVSWSMPTSVDADSTNAAVLDVGFPVDVNVDPNDFWAFAFGFITVSGLEVHARFQPIPCAAGSCRTTEPGFSLVTGRSTVVKPLAVGYRGEPGAADIAFRRSGIDVSVRATAARPSVTYTPSLFFLIYCFFDIIGCEITSDGITGQMKDTLVSAVGRAGTGLGALSSGANLGSAPLVDPAVGGTGLPADNACLFVDGLFGGCPFSSPTELAAMANNTVIQYSACDLRLGAPHDLADGGTGDRPTVTLGGTGSAAGARTDNTTEVLARGGSIVKVTLDASAFAGACNPDGTCAKTGAICNICATCATACFGVASPVAACGWCTGSASMTFNIAADLTLPDLGIAPIPAAPNFAAVADAFSNLSFELRRVFTRPIEDYSDANGFDAYYKRVTACAGGDPGCLAGPGETAAIFDFGVDQDRDGVDDATDNCVGRFNPGQADSDGDGLGDLCDLCPCSASRNTSDQDGDGIPDICDDDIDADGCINVLFVPPTPGCTPAPLARAANGDVNAITLARTYDQRPLSPNLDSAGAPVNTDLLLPGGDAFQDDCDSDDDADGILDDGAGDDSFDGTIVRSPCEPPLPGTSPPHCDDNCIIRPNPAQEDANLDGRGDACDIVCPSPTAHPFCTTPPGGGGGGGGGGSGGAPIASIAGIGPGRFISLGDCIADGPFCWGMLVGQCADPSASCGGGLDSYTAMTPYGDRLASVSASAVGVSAFGQASQVIPDFDGDGISEVALGAPDARVCKTGHGCADVGSVLIISSRTQRVLWRLDGQDRNARFGESLALAGNVLLVGAPGGRNVVGTAVGEVVRVRLDGEPVLDGVIYGETSGDRFGESLAAIGDAVGRPTGVLIGAPGFDGHAGRDAGRIYATSLAGASYTRFDGTTARGELGNTASVLLPNAFQGVGAVLATAPDALSGAGTVLLFDWSGHLIWHVDGSRGARLGASVTWAADFDGDGRQEVAIGAPGQGGGAGMVYIANQVGLFKTFLQGGPGDALGTSVAAPGDLNRDGSSDLVVVVGGVRPVARGPRGIWLFVPGAGGKNPNGPPGDVLPPP